MLPVAKLVFVKISLRNVAHLNAILPSGITGRNGCMIKRPQELHRVKIGEVCLGIRIRSDVAVNIFHPVVIVDCF